MAANANSTSGGELTPAGCIRDIVTTYQSQLVGENPGQRIWDLSGAGKRVTLEPFEDDESVIVTIDRPSRRLVGSMATRLGLEVSRHDTVIMWVFPHNGLTVGMVKVTDPRTKSYYATSADPIKMIAALREGDADKRSALGVVLGIKKA
jgi:hypothetical protein